MKEHPIHQRQFRKFGWYGLLKNLKLFEPYLLLYFVLFQSLTYTQIGVLFAIREIIIYIFEIPSGVIADRYGKKRELMASFLFYIVSFLFFFLVRGFWWLVLPMILFGLGEAFRSGTHKAMIMAYLDHNDITTSKKQVYGYTRSYSNIGSFLSSMVGIVFVLMVPDLNVLFLVATVPYVVDLLLIWSYPSYLDQSLGEPFAIRDLLREVGRSVRYLFARPSLRKAVLDASIFNALFKSIRDYIQPLLFTVGLMIVIVPSATLDGNAKVLVGLIYAGAQFLSVFATKNAYRLSDKMTTSTLLHVTWFLAGGVAVLLGIWSESLGVMILALVGFYLAQNIRKPYMVERIGNQTTNEKRSSVLSIESQTTSLLIVVLAPGMGWTADQFGIGTMFVLFGSLMILSRLLFLEKKDA